MKCLDRANQRRFGEWEWELIAYGFKGIGKGIGTVLKLDFSDDCTPLQID